MRRKARIWPVLVVITACLIGLAQPASLHAAGDAGHTEGGSGNAARDMNPLSIDPDLAVFTVIVFVVLFFVLKKFAWGPICEALDKREQGIADNIAAAQRTNDDAKALLGQYDEKIAQAHEEVRLLLEEARHDAEQTQQEIIAKANQEADASRGRAIADIETAKVQALKEVSEMGATMAVDLAGRIIAAEVKPADHAKLIETALAQVPGPKPSQN